MYVCMLFLCHIIGTLSYCLVFASFTLFNLSSLSQLFVIVDLIITLHLFLFLVNLYRFLCIFIRYFVIPIPNHIFFLYPIGLN